MSDRHPLDTDADIIAQPPLKICPFCGHVPLLLDNRARGFFIDCDTQGCPVTVGTRAHDTPELAAEAWNTRAVPEPHSH